MNEGQQRFDGRALISGLFLIALGVIFLLDRFDVIDFGYLIHTYWPLIIVAIGLAKLLRLRTVWSGLWLIGIGCWLQAVTLGLYGLTFSNSWPLLLIILGTGMVLRTFTEGVARRDRIQREDSNAR